MCSVTDCDRHHKARGLCALHYQRWRRTGDSEKVRPAGRPTDRWLEVLRHDYSRVWSPRTITRLKRVLRTCATYRPGSQLDDEWDDLWRVATRPNGTINVAQLERTANSRLSEANDAGLLDHLG